MIVNRIKCVIIIIILFDSDVYYSSIDVTANNNYNYMKR